jgi:hypothetical protein
MPRLTELSIHHEFSWNGMQLDGLVDLPLLRKSTITGSMAGTPLYKLKQLSQLRELELGHVRSEDFVSLCHCQPPHSLQLEALSVGGMSHVGEVEMRALLHLPTLAQLEPELIQPDAWLLLPLLPHLRRVMISPRMPFTAEMAPVVPAPTPPTVEDLIRTAAHGRANHDSQHGASWLHRARRSDTVSPPL